MAQRMDPITSERGFEKMETHWRWRLLGWLYLAAAFFMCGTSVGSISVSELGCLPLALAGLVSLDVVWPVLRVFLRQGLFWLIVAFAGWIALSLLWTPNVRKGLWEFSWMRFVWVLPALWPVMRHRRLLVYALALGFMVTNVTQLTQWAGHRWKLPWLMLRVWDERNAGWWSHPAVFGYMLAAALGLHLPAAVMGRGRGRLVGVAGCVVTLAGAAATGSRGLWLACGGLVVIAVAVAWRRHRAAGAANGGWGRANIAAAGMCVAALAAGGWVTGPTLINRARTGWGELQGAVAQQQFENDTGARVKFALWGVRMGLEHPIQGAGAGSYQHWVEVRLRSQGVDPATVRTAPQAHNLWLHAFATLGLTGVGLLVAIAVVAVRGAFEGLDAARLGTYEAGPAFALLGVLLTTPFDTQYVNTPPVLLLGVLLAMSLRWQPAEHALRQIWPRGRAE